MTQASFDLRVGGRVWFDGQGWEVLELTGTAARLAANGMVRPVSFTSLVGSRAEEDDPPDLQATTWEIPAVVVAGLTTRQQTQLAARLDVLRGVLEPDSGDDRTIRARYDAAAASVGVSRRTLQRQAARLLELGPAGLVDARLLQDVRRAVDPRWDAICLEVLSSFVNESNPTKQSVINRANREFARQVPDGKVPSTAVAYRRLKELDKGRYTSGAAKQRRSVANRPTGVLGRLRADRPGQ